MADDTQPQPQSHQKAVKRQNSTRLVHPDEIPVYLQRSSLQWDDLIYFLTDVEPARFNCSKPNNLRLSDDAWAALKLRVDPLARDILDPHRSFAAAVGMSLFITLVFLAVRPGYDRKRIHKRIGDDEVRAHADDDAIYDDYFEDDEWERKHNYMDDIVIAELEYLNAALDRSMWVWRIGLIFSLVVLFGAVLFIAVLMERRNATIDHKIHEAIEEIKPRVQYEGIEVEYRTKGNTKPGILFFLGKYIRPTRVVVFKDLGGARMADPRTKKTRSFFSEDYQRKYFPPSRSSHSTPRSTVGDEFTVSSSVFSLM
eukprot:scaffold1102_cov195-Alexandrium_tamarense.AAC.33